MPPYGMHTLTSPIEGLPLFRQHTISPTPSDPPAMPGQGVQTGGGGGSIPCKACGVLFTPKGRDWQSRFRKYCSSACRRDAVSVLYRNKEKVCRFCGKAFKGPASRKYCSDACFSEMRARKGRWHKCKTCGSLYQRVKGRESVYCSDKCIPARRSVNCAFCGGPVPKGRGVYSHTTSYCSVECKKAAYRRRREIRLQEARNLERAQVASMLRLWRNTRSLEAVEQQYQLKPGYAATYLHSKSKAYRRRAKLRKTMSRWYETESGRNARSSVFREECQFRGYVADVFRRSFGRVDVEKIIPGTRRRIDLFVEHAGLRFGVELKNGNRTARLDQTLGQALIKCAALGAGIIPVCAVPDDVRPDKVFLHGCSAYGAIAGKISEVVVRMHEVCLTQHPPPKVL